jgi:hypothetical protein
MTGGDMAFVQFTCVGKGGVRHDELWPVATRGTEEQWWLGLALMYNGERRWGSDSEAAWVRAKEWLRTGLVGDAGALIPD